MSEHEVELTAEERDILLDPCACGHTLNDHGDMGGCWICNETNDRECWVRCEDMFAERAARIVAARLADAEATLRLVRNEARSLAAAYGSHPEALHAGRTIADDLDHVAAIEALRGDQ